MGALPLLGIQALTCNIRLGPGKDWAKAESKGKEFLRPCFLKTRLLRACAFSCQLLLPHVCNKSPQPAAQAILEKLTICSYYSVIKR